MYKNILVPIDGSDTGARGLSEAITLAKALGARIRLLHIVNELAGIPADLTGTDFRSIVEDMRRHGETILSRAFEQVRTQGLEVDSQLLESWGGQAGELIIQQANDWPADLIVCGTHGRRGMRRILLGSDAEYVVRRSRIPVLLLRALDAHTFPRRAT